MESQGQHRHVVDAYGLEQRTGGPSGDPVEVGVQLLIELHDSFLLVPPYQEAHDGEGAAGAGGGVDIFHTGQFPGQFFQRPGDALLHLLGCGPGHLHEYIDDGYDDLGLLLSGQEEYRQCAEQKGGPHDQGREGRVNEEIQNLRD